MSGGDARPRVRTIEFGDAAFRTTSSGLVARHPIEMPRQISVGSSVDRLRRPGNQFRRTAIEDAIPSARSLLGIRPDDPTAPLHGLHCARSIEDANEPSTSRGAEVEIRSRTDGRRD